MQTFIRMKVGYYPDIAELLSNILFICLTWGKELMESMITATRND